MLCIWNPEWFDSNAILLDLLEKLLAVNLRHELIHVTMDDQNGAANLARSVDIRKGIYKRQGHIELLQWDAHSRGDRGNKHEAANATISRAIHSRTTANAASKDDNFGWVYITLFCKIIISRINISTTSLLTRFRSATVTIQQTRGDGSAVEETRWVGLGTTGLFGEAVTGVFEGQDIDVEGVGEEMGVDNA